MEEITPAVDKSERIVSFDLLKLFAIYLVVLGHCVQHLLPTHPYDEPMYIYIYSFHMPLFMMMSGYFSYKQGYNPRINGWGGVKKRFLQLIVPSVVWSFIHLILVLLYQDDVSLPLRDCISNEVFNTLWFLKSLFICYILFVSLFIINKYARIIVLFLLCIVVPFLGMFHLKLMIICYFVGIILKKNNTYWGKSKVVITLLSGFSFASCLILWNADFFRSPAGIFSGLMKGNYYPMSLYLFRYIVSLLTGITGGIFFMSLFCVISFKRSRWLIISKYGQLTLGVYILQTVLLETVLPHYIQFSNNTPFVYWIIIPTIAIIIVLFCLFLTKIMMRFNHVNKVCLGCVSLK